MNISKNSIPHGSRSKTSIMSSKGSKQDEEEGGSGLNDNPELFKGPFEDTELHPDVYACSYIVARNATPGLYSFFPWQNRQMWIVWLSLGFIVFSQVFVILAFGWWYPPSVKTDVEWITCRGIESDPVEEK